VHRFTCFWPSAEDWLPLDPVVRFQLGNDAQIYDVYVDADMSSHELFQLSGAMVNYLYDLTQTQNRHEAFKFDAVVASAKPAQA